MTDNWRVTFANKIINKSQLCSIINWHFISCKNIFNWVNEGAKSSKVLRQTSWACLEQQHKCISWKASIKHHCKVLLYWDTDYCSLNGFTESRIYMYIVFKNEFGYFHFYICTKTGHRSYSPHHVSYYWLTFTPLSSHSPSPSQHAWMCLVLWQVTYNFCSDIISDQQFYFLQNDSQSVRNL